MSPQMLPTNMINNAMRNQVPNAYMMNQMGMQQRQELLQRLQLQQQQQMLLQQQQNMYNQLSTQDTSNGAANQVIRAHSNQQPMVSTAFVSQQFANSPSTSLGVNMQNMQVDVFSMEKMLNGSNASSATMRSSVGDGSLSKASTPQSTVISPTGFVSSGRSASVASIESHGTIPYMSQTNANAFMNQQMNMNGGQASSRIALCKRCSNPFDSGGNSINVLCATCLDIIMNGKMM